MTQQNGTLLVATVRPNDSQDNFAVALVNELKGGLHSYSNFSDLDLTGTLFQECVMSDKEGSREIFDIEPELLNINEFVLLCEE